ncbi:MAG TPA: hypothetical protein VGE27_01915 [Gemmatimonas sp.]|uniref:hypothetical protein n=1 Tax=Gemmatimonas sp. TaxID=1962908 RepID=UPI002ED9C8A7
MMIGAAQTVLSFALVGCALLSVETLRAARRAIRRGTAAWELEAAFVQDPLGIDTSTPDTSLRSLIGGTVAVTGAAAMALAQGNLPSSPLIPEFASGMLQAVLLLAPPIVMHRGLTSLWNGSAFTRRMGKRIGGLLASGLASVFGAKNPASPGLYASANASTEIRLGKDVEAILARLPASLQKQLPLLHQTVERLATQAEQLRRRDAGLVGLAEMTEERRVVRARLSATIAALETVRLDLRRLESTQTLPGELTESLDVLRDLQRHVDAVAEVRRTLQLPSLTPSPTPV